MVNLWTPERIKELLISHQGRSHSETAKHLSEIWGISVSRDAVKNKFNSVIAKGIVDPKKIEPTFSRDSFNKTVNDEELSFKRTYLVTCAIAGSSLNSDFFESIKTFLATKKAKLVVLPMRGAASSKEEYTKEVIEKLGKHFYTEYTFNSNLEAFDIGLNPNTVSPLTGLARLAQKKSSLIIASPKQNMNTIPVSNVGIPHIIHSTGAVTNPLYGANKIGILANEDHIFGALIVEIQDKEIFHLRQIQADKDGSFYDLNKKYTPKGIEEATAEAFVLGDIHCGSEDPGAMRSWEEVMNLMRPKHIFWHDLFDANSVNYHMDNNLYAKTNRPPIFQFIKTELDNLGKFILYWTQKFPEMSFYSVKSNHEDFLINYLDQGKFIFDHHNYRLALELAMWRCDGKNPIEEYINSRFGAVNNLHWLKTDDSFEIAGIQLASHGHIGNNGAKGTLTGTENGFSNSVTGHAHSPQIQRLAWQVGTSTVFRLGYNVGPSSWIHSSCLIFPNGQRQLINSINGVWRIS